MKHSRLVNAIAGGLFAAIFPAGCISEDIREACREVAEQMSPGYDSAQVIKQKCGKSATERANVYFAFLALVGASIFYNLPKGDE